ncbi:MAG: (2Fe-2S)-binding protein [Desulfobacterales bacterium]|nr:(2Fe-2S)-binding protein [Desulfobacterales bacterium]
MSAKRLDCIVNGERISLEIPADALLLDVIRERLNLTGTKKGCGEGECGACTVIVDGKIINSCIYPAFQANGKEIITVEGLSDGEMTVLQKAFINSGAVQCGFCTPGMLLSAKVILDKNPNPTREEIRKGISGNLCRCTGYSKIIDAIETASKMTSIEE